MTKLRGRVLEDTVMVAKTTSFEQSVCWIQLAWQVEASALILLFPGDSQQPRPVKVSWCPLSERELDVLIEVAKGFGNFNVGKNLGISSLTVKSHLTRIAKTLNVQGDRAGLISIAIREGWI